MNIQTFYLIFVFLLASSLNIQKNLCEKMPRIAVVEFN
jgi:hypothetical protein